MNRLNGIYYCMIKRCYDKKNNRYNIYGGRGIAVCDEWLDKKVIILGRRISKGYLAFKEWALSHGYDDDLTIDRIDNNKGYSPENCRWVTPKEQANNRRTSVLVTYKGEAKTLPQWCEELNLDYKTVRQRINKLHWSVEKAFETKGNPRINYVTYKGRTQSIAQWCKELNLNFWLVRKRIESGWSVEKTFETPSRRPFKLSAYAGSS